MQKWWQKMPKQRQETKLHSTGASEVSEDIWIPTTCWGCVEGPCLIRVHRVNGVAVDVQGNAEVPGFKELSKNKGHMCPKPYGLIQKVYNPYRIRGPLKRTNPEKGPGVDPKWVEISWDEALGIVAERLEEIRAKDPRGLCFHLGYGVHARLNGGTWRGFFSAWGPWRTLSAGASMHCDLNEHLYGNLIHGGWQCEPDLDYCNYLLVCGANNSASGGVPENVLYINAVARGMKRVVIDPVLSLTAAKADEWLPIRPGTDTAFMLALIQVIVNELGIYDKEFLKNMTNSPYLVGADGYFVRDKATGRILIWDLADRKAKAHDDESIKDFALEGVYLVDGAESRPAFQVLKEHVRQYTPEWASSVTDIGADAIRRVAREFVDNARIGSTINIGGVELPYRPVAIELGRGTTGVMRSYQCLLADHILACLVGALEVPGGHQGGRAWALDLNRGIVPGPDGMNEPETRSLTWPPVSYGGAESLVPYAKSHGDLAHLAWRNLVEPPKNFPLPPPPEAYIRVRCNPLLSLGEPEIVAEALKKIPFVVSIAYTDDEVAPYADIVLPDRTELERFEVTNWVRSAAGKKYWGIQLRQPVIEPVHNTMDIADIFTELADRIGFLDEYNMAVNTTLNLVDPYKLEPGKKYAWVDIVDRQCKSLTNGAHDLGWFKENGTLLRAATVDEQYDVHMRMKAEKLRYPIPYFEHVKRTGEELARNLAEVGIDWWPTSEYVPLPIYVPPILEEVAPEYDFYVTTLRSMQFSMGLNVDVPWLIEVAKHVRGQGDILMNVTAARARGIKDGDKIWVESEVGKVKGKVKLCQGIRPDTLAITGQFGQWATPIAKDTSWVSMTPLIPIRHSWTDHMVGNMQAQVVKAKVYKA